MLGTGFVLLGDLLLPDHIARWQRGAWGEQNTATVLKHLPGEDWLVRHDLASGYLNTNRDHILAGPAVYLLDSKLLRDEVWVDAAGLHVRRVDETRDEYVIPGLTRRMYAAAKSLERDIAQSVGFPVAVYPVVVVWGYFGEGETWDGSVAYVNGEQLVEWLRSRPTDLLTAEKRDAVRRWLRGLPRSQGE